MISVLVNENPSITKKKLCKNVFHHISVLELAKKKNISVLVNENHHWLVLRKYFH
jgi:hypothetical protein